MTRASFLISSSNQVAATHTRFSLLFCAAEIGCFFIL